MDSDSQAARKHGIYASRRQVIRTNCSHKAEAALTEAGWFVDATASTTAHMLGGVLLPHDVVEVEGLGQEHSGPYQVKAVTHVINAADHFMDIQLRRNAIGGG